MANALNLWHPVAAPPAVPYRYGLFSVVSPRNAELTPTGAIEEHWRAGVVWESQACRMGSITQGPCIDPEYNWAPDNNGALGTNSCSPLNQFDPFTVYVYNNDSIPGYTLEQHMQQTIERLTNNEQRLVEEAVMYNIDQCSGAVQKDFTGDDIKFALGFLEDFLSYSYGGTGVIYMTRATTTILWENLRVEGARLVTTNGTPVVSFADTRPPVAGPYRTASMYATGTPVMYRGDIDVRESAINKPINEVSYIAQRDYVFGWDCVCAEATVRLAPDPA